MYEGLYRNPSPYRRRKTKFNSKMVSTSGGTSEVAVPDSELVNTIFNLIICNITKQSKELLENKQDYPSEQALRTCGGAYSVVATLSVLIVDL